MNKRYLVLMAAASMTAAAQPAGLNEVLAGVAKYEYGQSRAPLIEMSAIVRRAMPSPAGRLEAEAALDRLLDSDATLAGKDAVCRELSLIGSEKSLPVLRKLLSVKSTAEMARYALERIPGPQVDRALRAALAASEGRTRVGIVNSLGRRRDSAAVPLLKPLLASSDTVLAAAAADALAKIADAPARAALSTALAGSGGPRRIEIGEAMIRCADRLVEDRQKAAALAIYRNLNRPSEPVILRIAALSGLAASGESVTPLLTAALDGNDPALRLFAIRALARAPGASAANTLVERLPHLPREAQVQALAALAGRGDRAVLPVFNEMLRSPDPAVRVAALEGLEKIGDARSVMLLARTAAAATGAERDAARHSLDMLAGHDIDEAVVAGLAAGDASVRVELIRAAGDRPVRSAAAPLLAAAGDSNPDVRREAVRALRDVAGPGDAPALITLLRKAGQISERRDAQRALLSALRQSKQSHASELMSACRSANDAETRKAFLEVMAQTGAEETLPLFRELLAQSDDDSRRAAINALSQWTSAAPAPDLLQTARSGSNPAHRVLALRAYITVVSLPSARPPAETAKMLADALPLAAQPEEKRAVLAALPRAPSPEALSLAESLLNDSSVAAEAKTAVNALKRVLSQKQAP